MVMYTHHVLGFCNCQKIQMLEWDAIVMSKIVKSMLLRKRSLKFIDCELKKI